MSVNAIIDVMTMTAETIQTIFAVFLYFNICPVVEIRQLFLTAYRIIN